MLLNGGDDMEFLNDKHLKRSMFYHLLVVLISFFLLVFNLDSLDVFAKAIHEVGAFMFISFLFYLLFSMLLAMELNELVFRKFAEMRKVKS